MTDYVKAKVIQVGLGAITYFYTLALEKFCGETGGFITVLYAFAWLVLSFSVMLEIYQEIRKFNFFNENVLMLLATFGAMIVGKEAEAVGVMLVFQVGKLIEKITLNRTKKSIAQYMDIRPDYATLKHVDREEIVSPSELKVGQTIVIKPGEKIPVDAVVTLGTSNVDMKALTGEAEPREVKIGKRLYSGCINLSGVLEARVVKEYEDSTASRIMTLVEKANQRKADSEGMVEKFTQIYTPLVMILGILVMIIPPLVLPGHDTEIWVYRGMIFLVAACPIGLLVSVPMAFLGGIGAASKQGVLIKGCNFLEALAETEMFVFDKTGTLTEGVFTVKKVCPYGISSEELLELTAHGEAYSNHPIAMSLREAYGKDLELSRVEDVREISGFGVLVKVDGKNVCIGNAKFMNRQGLFYQPVAEVGTAVYVAVEDEYVGYILIADIIRKDAKRTVRWLLRHNIEVTMLTGDNKHVARDVAAKLGIANVYANLLPENKVERVEEILDSTIDREKLAFIGDGINDAPVLARADVGIAMGGLGADAAIEAADIILMEDETYGIVKAIRISRATIRVVKQNVAFAIGMKIILLIFAFLGYVNMQTAIMVDMAVMFINILNSYWVIRYPE